MKRKLHTVYEGRDMMIHALPVPGGLLMITESWAEGDNNISCSVAQTFLRLTHSEIVEFLGLEDQP